LVPKAYRVHHAIDSAVPPVLLAAGLLSADPLLWYSSFGILWGILLLLVVGGAALSNQGTKLAKQRIQGPRRKPAPVWREAFESGRAMFVMATLAAWPMAQWRAGHPTGMVLDLEAHGIVWWHVVVQTVVGVFAVDGWLYLKHRLLHTRALFGFHRQHHAFRDPTALAGFGVGPVESVMTFWPVLILCIPEATHWAPLYFGLVLGFVVLNFYLHCGVTLSWVEAVLPRLMLNTSAFHNIHHSHANANFGEPMFLWDLVFKTRLQDLPHVKPLAAD
jgi:lathosterol oxidase